MSEISLCCLNQDEYKDLELKDYLKNYLNLSGQAIKRSNLSKAQLTLKLSPKKEIGLPIDLVNKGLVSPSYKGALADLLYEDQDFLAIDKPAGVHLHPLVYSDQENLLSYLRSINKCEVMNVATHTQERGWLYRLDKETSGVVIGVKSNNLYETYRKNFSSQVVLKRYLCVVEGNCSSHGEVELFYRPHSKKGAKMKASFVEYAGELGKMKIDVLYKQDDWSLLQVDLETGLRHQIRSGLSALGHPIVGDELYGAQKSERVYLHAFEYHLRRELKPVMQIQSSLGGVFERFLDLDSLLKVLHDKSLIS